MLQTDFNAPPAWRLDPAWVARLKHGLDLPPVRARMPLLLATAGRRTGVAIGSIEPALAIRLAIAGHPLRDAGDAWHIELPSEANVTPALAAIAQWLHASDLAAAWRDELLCVTDPSGSPVALVERSAVRPLGIATYAVHLVASGERGCVWVQQRAFDKATDPGRWDTTMGGLVSAGESTLQTLARETWEEAGLRIEILRGAKPFGRMTVRRPVTEGYMVEHIDMFEATVPDGVVPLNRDGEVERFECLDRASLVERLHADAFTLEAGMILATWLERRAATGR